MYSGGIYSNTGNKGGTGLTSSQLKLVNSIPEIKKEMKALVIGEVRDDKVASGYDYAKRFADKFI